MSCTDFQQHVYAHYAGNNTLHNDSGKAHELYQTSVMSALIEGVYEGEVTYGELAQHGDFGLGTFNDLDGEMVAFDGQFFQLRADGTAAAVHPDQKTPFAAVNFFRDEIVREIKSPIDRQGLQALIDGLVTTNNLFFAIRVDGHFQQVSTRTVSRQKRPFRPLTEVTKEQSTFHFENMPGTLAGYRSPNYAQGLTVAGYHLHFINQDRTGGGHVLDFMLTDGILRIDHYSSIFVALPETPDFEKARMDKDSGDAIKQAEG
jgi:acetolactate decarboxylase